MRDTKAYRVAERAVHFQEALNTANQILRKHGLLGVIPDASVSFREAPAFHAKVRKLLKNYG